MDLEERKIPEDNGSEEPNSSKKEPRNIKEEPNQVKEEPNSPKDEPNRIYIDEVRWFTYKQLSNILHCTPQSIYNHVRTGKVKVKKVDGLSFYRLDEYM